MASDSVYGLDFLGIWRRSRRFESDHFTGVAPCAPRLFASLAIVRTADKRFFAKKTAFDVILAFILGSMLGRAINGSEQLAPTIVAGFLLVWLHRVLGWAACKWPAFGGLIKGYSQTLIEDGQVKKERLEHHRIGEDDLLEELRPKGIESPEHAKFAKLERSGEISVIRATTERGVQNAGCEQVRERGKIGGDMRTQ